VSTRSPSTGSLDAFELVALVASARREDLLRINRHRLTAEDLEDCYGQATLELLGSVRHGRAFKSRQHIANALDQRLSSRIDDRRRALSGRSPMAAALAVALPLTGVEHADERADVERLVQLRQQLRMVIDAATQLSSDQRLALHAQLSGPASAGELCRREGWSSEKYRKLAQRARARLRGLLECPDPGCASDE
jgi:DNA-directed RNA polymerase specialized sigma24 family protein